METVSRRSFLKNAGAATLPLLAGAGSVAQLACNESVTKKAGELRPVYTALRSPDADFIEAAVSRLIPSDDLGPGALEAGVPNYIDKQLSGAWGNGEQLYRSGPWQKGSPSQGYQLPFTPAELFRHALPAVHEHVLGRHHSDFDKLSAQQQDAYLRELQKGGIDLGGVPSEVFFATLWALTLEGYFSDPVYGGNKDMGSWRMIGFPGAYAAYYDVVDKHGLAYRRAPMSIADGQRRALPQHPGMPAQPAKTAASAGAPGGV